MEAAIQRYAPNVSARARQLALLVVVVAVLSAFVKNIGALAIMIPIAFQFARRSGTSPSMFLMPMAFASLLGGLMTQIGTSPNIVVSRVREEITGERFTCSTSPRSARRSPPSGCVFLVAVLLAAAERPRQGGAIDEALDIKNYMTEAKVVGESAVARQDRRRPAQARRRRGDRHLDPPARGAAHHAASRRRAARWRHCC